MGTREQLIREIERLPEDLIEVAYAKAEGV